MTVREIVVIWKDNCTVERQTRRGIVGMTDDWIDGWLAGCAEFISYRGGRIISVEIKEPK